jgi:hypothetical protein
MKKIYLFYFLLLLGYNEIQAQAGCLSDIVISGSYATTYTNSYTWIKTSGLTTIPTGSDVTLDANPVTDGYVLMDVGFETQPNSIFLAVVQTPCVSLGIDQNEVLANLTVFPNPTSTNLNIKSIDTILQTELVDFNGRIILSSAPNQKEFIINMEGLSSGMYLLKVTTEKGTSIEKIVKK